MEPFDVLKLPEKLLAEGIDLRLVHGDHMSFSYVKLRAGARLPEHAHPHEQIHFLLEGELELTVGDKIHHLTPLKGVVIPGNVEHSAVAITDCIAIDVFSPVREDYK